MVKRGDKRSCAEGSTDPSLPKVSHGTKKGSCKASDTDLIYEIKEKVLKSLKEDPSNHRMVGFEGKNKPFVFLWQPHNLRRYFDFSRVNFSTKKPSNHAFEKLKTMVPTLDENYQITMVNHGSEAIIRGFMFCTIRVKKNQVEVINNFNDKQWRKISADNISQINERIDQVMKELGDWSLQVLKIFMSIHGGRSDFKVLNERCEHGIHGIDFLDKIPAEMVINDTVFKKVYKQKTEFKDVGSLKNFVTNMSLKNVVPEITDELETNRKLLHGSFEKIEKCMMITEEHIQLVAQAQVNTQKQLSSLIKVLTPPKRPDIKLERPDYFG